MKKHTAFVFGPDGSVARFWTSLSPGCKEGREFAKTAKLAMRDGGVSIVVSGAYTLSSVRAAINKLEKIGD